MRCVQAVVLCCLSAVSGCSVHCTPLSQNVLRSECVCSFKLVPVGPRRRQLNQCTSRGCVSAGFQREVSVERGELQADVCARL
jgi:hypothetical protein